MLSSHKHWVSRKSALLMLFLVSGLNVQAADSSGETTHLPKSHKITPTGSISKPYRTLEIVGRVEVNVLLDGAVLGNNDIEIAEIVFYPSTSISRKAPALHTHDSQEFFYVLEGQLTHIVNGESQTIGPGGLAIVRSGESVAHKLDTNKPVRALAIWVPGGELDRLKGFGFVQRAIPQKLSGE
jgi:mannose-6-phosphate isomerase-like protein (cupin superfamily)